MPACRSLCFGFLFLSLLTRDVALADAIDSWEARRQQQSKDNEAMLSNLPLLEKTRLRDLLQIRTEGHELTVRTPLSSTRASGFARCRLEGSNQYALIRVQGGNESENGEAVVPINLQFNYTDYSQPHQISTLAVTTQVMFLNISKHMDFPSGYQHVQLMEQTSSDGAGQSGSITLAVNESTPFEGPPINLSLEADDFHDFLRRYPRESEKYVRPLLRELDQESVFAPDPMIAWQVFSDLWKPNSATCRQVNELLLQLDVADFHQRQKALDSLRSLGRDGAAVMVHLDRTQLTAEQNARVDRALAPFTRLPAAEAVELRSRESFLLDCFYCEDVAIRRAALRRLRELVGPVQFDVESNPDLRPVAVAELRRSILGAASH